MRGLGESFESQDFTGTASVSIPIPVPAARGLEPGLRLAYGSGGGNGVFGMGFGLALPGIARKTSDGIPRYDDTDTFILSDEGELTPALTWNEATQTWVPDRRLEPQADPVWEVVAYRPRHEGSFARIERWVHLASGESHWRLLTRVNELRLFGRTEEARIFDPDQPRRIFQWLLEETRDAHGNKILYHYDADDRSQPGHEHRANRYLSEIEHGNHFAQGEERFAFRTVFDYGERPDAFSSYRSGFEVRTARRCEQIRILHHFQDQADGKPFLTRTLRFDYELAPESGLSFLSRIEETGFRQEDDGILLSQSLPPLVFTYAGFDPAGQHYQELEVEGCGSLPGTLTQGRYLPIDLQGDGLPGILYSDGVTTLYWEPQGGGRYSGPHNPDRFPVDRDLRNPGLTLTSLEGNGEPDLLVRTPGRSGFYRSARAGAWEPFQPFSSVPTALLDPRTEMVDMDGSGRADLLVLENDRIFSYPSLGLEGYGPPDVAQIETGFPAAEPVGQDEVLTFADLFGDGLSHRVRIRSGLVECWPNLGHGRFGPKVILDNAPSFEGRLDARRLFLADVDGSGTADLIYMGFDRFQVWFNQSGNGFGEPLTLPLPAPYDDLSQVSFADVHGNGTSCLILTRLLPQVVHHAYDFAGDEKPYLLTAVDNGMGATTRIRYTTSVQQSLADRQAGRPWATRLFFPVHVVDEVERRDDISRTRYVTRHKYHDGYYDPQEREFRGFGFVETWDSEDFESFVERIDETLWVPPAYTRTWYHTGAFLESGAISRQDAGEFWHGDPLASSLPGSIFASEILDQDAATLRQAHEALAGQMRRREVYGLDGSPAAADPYTVSETTVRVRLVQPRAQQPHAVLFAYPEESLVSNYERQADDPQVRHEVNLAVDEFGNVTRSGSVAYPRRKNPGVTVYPEQETLRTVVTEETFINHADTKQEPYRWIGMSCERREHELEGLTPPHQGRFSFADLERQVREALGHPLVYDQPFTPGEIQARLFSWSRACFWNEAQTEALPLAKISSRGLLHHEESAVLTSRLVEEAFGERVLPDQLAQAGYWPDQGYWWARGLIQHYYREPERFFLPCRVDGAFAGVDPASHLNPTTTVAYDLYSFLPAEVTSFVRDALTLTATAEIDYWTMSPWRLTDANGNVSEVLFDPLGKVVVSTVYGTEEGRPAGDAPLKDYTLQPAATLQDVLDHPETYLQDATTFFFYDLFAWSRSRQPASTVSLHRQKHVRELAPDEVSRLQTGVTYSDGFGRLIESKLETDPGPLQERRWIVSGRTVYNNKGKAAEQYLPWFSDSPSYEGQEQVLPPTVFHYDPLDRLVRTDTPKGFFSKVELSAWQTKTYDEDDTVLDSAYYKTFMKDYPEHPTREQKNEKDALDKAAAFYDTPSVDVLDNLGRTARSLKNNLGAVGPNAFQRIVGGSGCTLKELWNRLVAFLAFPGRRPAATWDPGDVTPEELWSWLVEDGYLAKDLRDPAVAWVTEKLQPYDPSFQQAFADQYHELAAPILGILKENGLTTLHVLDIEGRVVRSVDPRLFYSNVTRKTDWINFVYLYDMAGNALRTTSADAGIRWSLADVFGKPIESWDSRGFRITRHYDRLERPTEVRVQGGDGGALDNLTEVLIYGEGRPDATANNLNGQAYQHYDPAGLVTQASYSLGGQVMTTTRQVRPDYHQEADWTPQAREQVALEEEFTTRFLYDALDRVLLEVTPDRSVTTPHYNQAGQLRKVTATLSGPAGEVEETIVEEIDYDAQGQRTFILYGNGVETRYGYEETTLRLVKIHTTRSEERLQDIAYTYDPVGNVTRKEDASWKTVFCHNQEVNPLSSYTYDALYRVVRATGRQLLGLQGPPDGTTLKFLEDHFIPFCPPGPDDRKLESYIESYRYDDGGNLICTRHRASQSWTRVLPVEPGSNRLANASYDPNGNIDSLDHLRSVVWNYRNNLARVDVVVRDGGTNDSEYYLYDGGGNRILKVAERVKSETGVTEIEEKIYLGNYQVKRIKVRSGVDTRTLLQRDSLSVTADQARVCLIHSWPIDALHRESKQAGERHFRYSLGDNLGSVALEVNERGERITYEEYFPYGGTAFIAGKSAVEVKLQEYRYSGKENDSMTGLYYYGARYYPPWMGRWMNPDPAWTVDGLNLYAFVGGNPVTRVDELGMAYTCKTCGGNHMTRNHEKSAANSKKRSRDGSSDDDSNDDDPPAKKPAADDTFSLVTTGTFTLEIKPNKTTYLPANQPGLSDLVSNYGVPVQHVVKTWVDFAGLIGYEVGKSRKGILSANTRQELHELFEAIKPLHFQFNSALGDPWITSMNNYSGNKHTKQLYSVMRSKQTEYFKTINVGGKVTLNEWFKEVTGRPLEIHHVLFKAIYPDYANQPANLVAVGRSKRESEFGPGQHELMHLVASGGHKDKFNKLLPQFTEEYIKWLKNRDIPKIITLKII